MLLHWSQHSTVVQNIYGDCLLTVEISEEKKKEHWQQHHNLWPNFFQAWSAKRIVVVVPVHGLMSPSNGASGTGSFRPTCEVNPFFKTSSLENPTVKSVWKKLYFSSGSKASRPAVSLYVMLNYTWCCPRWTQARTPRTLCSTCSNSPWPGDYMIQSTKITLSHLVRRGGDWLSTQMRHCSTLKKQFLVCNC